jgi:transposase-like protein
MRQNTPKVYKKGYRHTSPKNKQIVLRKIKQGFKSKTEIAASIGVTPKTLYQWINEENQRLELLKPEQKIKLWERESIKNQQLAATARDSLQKELETNNAFVSIDQKARIMHSASWCAGVAWDKSRLESGQGISSDVHAIIINMYERHQQPVDVSEPVIAVQEQPSTEIPQDTGNKVIDA